MLLFQDRRQCIDSIHCMVAIFQSIAMRGDRHLAHPIAAGYSHHFLAETSKNSDRSQRHLSKRSASVCPVYVDRGRDRSALDQFFAVYEEALDGTI